MDLTLGSTTNSLVTTSLTPVFGDNVQDLLGTGALHVNPSAIITVNSIADAVDNFNSGVTTLRDAINQANADTGSDLIVFDRSLFTTAQTIGLNLGELDITHNLDIIAPRDSLTGGDLVTVSGNNATRVFEIGTDARVNLSGLIVADGKVTNDNGGGIKNSGTLTLDSSIVRGDSATQLNNFAVGTGNGGGIYNIGTMTVSNSTISHNSAPVGDSAPLGGSGGGIYNLGASLTVSNSTISDNSSYSGGGIFNAGSGVKLTVNNSTISDNSSLFTGGGIFNNSSIGISTTVSNSTINGNSTIQGGGGISNSGGTFNMSNSTINGNSATLSGGGISNDFGIFNLSNSTVSNNSVNQVGSDIDSHYGGGGIYNNYATMNVSNSTISSNVAANANLNSSTHGGGIYNGGKLTLVFSTLTLNQADIGSGVYIDPGAFSLPPGSVSARNTIIAGNVNSTGGVNPDVAGNFSSKGYNLIGDSTGSTGFDATGDIVGTHRYPIDPRLAPLNFYGGSTQTMALLPASPAIGAADLTVLNTDPTTDQRGLSRRASDGRADIGAKEFS